MKKHLTMLLVLFCQYIFSQEQPVNLFKLNFCPLTLDDLKKIDPEIKLVAIEQKDFCKEYATEDGNPEIKFGYKSRLFPGVRFYEPKNDEILISKIHLTKEFKGYLPDGKFVEVKTLTVSTLVNMYTSIINLTPNKCNNYFELIKDEGQNFILKVYKTNELSNQAHQIQYEQQLTESIDILFECYIDSREEKNKPLYILNGKEVKEEEVLALDPDIIKSITVLKDNTAEMKYGTKAKNGAIEIKTK